ncbi:MAG: hypothetical protein ABWY25_03610 [Paenisporosarcina sp.]
MPIKQPLIPVMLDDPSDDLPPNAPILTGFTCIACGLALEYINYTTGWIHTDNQETECENLDGIITEVPTVEPI